jgi:hypothetical protein
MPEIQPRYIKLADLFSNRLFRIPQYQRSYSWEKNNGLIYFPILRRVSIIKMEVTILWPLSLV